MNKDLFDCFKSLYFTNNEISYIEDNNENIYFLSVKHFNFVLNYLLEIGLSYIEIKKILLSNVFFITITNNNLEAFSNIFIKKLNLKKEDLINIISLNIDFNEIDFDLITESNVDNIKCNLKKYIKKD